MGTQTPGKRGNVTLIHLMSDRSKFFIDEVLQCLVHKYQITYQNIWGEGVIRPYLVQLDYYKISEPLKGALDLNHFLHKKMICSNCSYMKENFKNDEAYQNI